MRHRTLTASAEDQLVLDTWYEGPGFLQSEMAGAFDSFIMIANTPIEDGKTRIRHEVNVWIRSRAAFDAVIDFDRVVADASNPDLIRPAFNCGDGIHPSPRGYFEMGSALDLALFAPR